MSVSADAARRLAEAARRVADDVEECRARRAEMIDTLLHGASEEEREHFRLALLDALSARR